MKVIKREEFLENLEFYENEILAGKIFIYPTDTVYGIGCIISNEDSIRKIKFMKKRDENKPLSIIVPNKEWIYFNCEVHTNHQSFIEELPGPYTFILNLVKKNMISNNINNSSNTIGVRIPNNWFCSAISDIGIVFVTTSVNLAGEKQIQSLQDLDIEQFINVDYFIDDGELNGKSSTIIDLRNAVEKIIRN